MFSLPRLSHPETLLAALTIALAPATVSLADHPSLLITSKDLPRIRHACGVGQPLSDANAAESQPTAKFGAAAANYQALRSYFATHVAGDALPGELLAAAFLQVADPRDPGGTMRLKLIETSLAQPNWVTNDPLELVLALDWCYTSMEPGARRDFLLTMRERAEVLTPADSPLDPRKFRDKLATVALALAITEQDDPNPSWKLLRTRILDEARKYFTTTLPAFIQWRGLSPTGPAVAAREECDTVLAVELAAELLGPDVWKTQQGQVGRWLEHYALATLEHPALHHDFLHDDGSAAPLTPAPHWRELLPLTAHLLATRTQDPAAALCAHDVESALRDTDTLAGIWRWLPIAFDVENLATADTGNLPISRHLGSAVVFRAGSGVDTTAVWIDAAQPFLRRRQHFDAGHFVVERAGHLINQAGDDIAFEAVRGKTGTQQLGVDKGQEPFEFEQFFIATIAHNLPICYDSARITEWHGKRFIPAGGQRCIGETCTNFATPLAAQGRATGKTLAYGQQGGAAYLALDLSPAYDPRTVSGCTREFVFFAERVLVVVDRMKLTSPRAPATWILNVPGRPVVDGQPLKDDARVAGAMNDGGIWRCDAAGGLRWNDGDGALWFAPALPTPRHLQVVGGPAQRREITQGPAKGRTYAGGDADGFERLVLPGGTRGALNAWYRLGAPDSLGPEFDKSPHWGRIEMESAQRSNRVLFAAVLVTDRADGRQQPTVNVESDGDDQLIRIRVGEDEALLRITPDAPGGTLTLTGRRPLTWTLPHDVQPDEPLPTRPGH